MSNKPPIPLIQDGDTVALPATGAWPDAAHTFDRSQAYALWAAMAADRPLLVYGEPGVGKSQLARAAAAFYGRLFVSTVVYARSEATDLQWQFDAIARLGEAQALGAARATDADPAELLDPLNYLSPGPLWWTLAYESALTQHARCRHAPLPPALPEPNERFPEPWTPGRGAVLLIDEIDKAEADLPNGLLEVLGNGGFAVPFGHPPVRHAAGPAPLVIITSNEERDLPRAFVRRCLVLRLALPADTDESGFVTLLAERGARHFPNSSPAVRDRVARDLHKARRDLDPQDPNRPGQAEYLDLLRALEEVEAESGDREAAQLRRLKEIAGFALKKSTAQG